MSPLLNPTLRSPCAPGRGAARVARDPHEAAAPALPDADAAGSVSTAADGFVTEPACTDATVRALRLLEGKWKFAILAQLFAADAVRYSELERSVDGATHKVLVHQLKQLEKDGIVRRTAYPVVPPKVEYSLTEFGRSLGPVLTALREWALDAPSTQHSSPPDPDAAASRARSRLPTQVR